MLATAAIGSLSAGLLFGPAPGRWNVKNWMESTQIKSELTIVNFKNTIVELQ
jgi:hypothetical protein